MNGVIIVLVAIPISLLCLGVIGAWSQEPASQPADILQAGRGNRPLDVPARPVGLSDWDRFWDAIAQVESGGDDYAVGKHGERGRLQITPALWGEIVAEHGLDWPLRYARRPAEARYVATLATWRYAKEERLRSDYRAVAAIYHGGIMGQGRPAAKQYADRVMNLMEIMR